MQIQRQRTNIKDIAGIQEHTCDIYVVNICILYICIMYIYNLQCTVSSTYSLVASATNTNIQ